MRVGSSNAEEAVRGACGAGPATVVTCCAGWASCARQLGYAVDPHPEEVDGLMELVQQSSARASDVVAAAFFRPVGTIVWSN